MTNKSRFFYGWVIVIAGFFSVAMFGVINSYSTFIKPLEEYLKVSRTEISTAYMIEMIFYSAFAMVMGWLCDRAGPRTALWVSAVFMGAGMALCSTITAIGAGVGIPLELPHSDVRFQSIHYLTEAQHDMFFDLRFCRFRSAMNQGFHQNLVIPCTQRVGRPAGKHGTEPREPECL